jgi:DinB family protein
MSAKTIDSSIGQLEERLLREAYGEGAWHGPDLKAALSDVDPDAAFRRPAPGRHNIAEIALHHAYYVHGVRAKLTDDDVEPFVLEGDDWFALPDSPALSWQKVRDVVQLEQERLARMVGDIRAGRSRSPLSESEHFDLVLGITCHAVYHAGQIQLIKRLV